MDCNLNLKFATSNKKCNNQIRITSLQKRYILYSRGYKINIDKAKRGLVMIIKKHEDQVWITKSPNKQLDSTRSWMLFQLPRSTMVDWACQVVLQTSEQAYKQWNIDIVKERLQCLRKGIPNIDKR